LDRVDGTQSIEEVSKLLCAALVKRGFISKDLMRKDIIKIVFTGGAPGSLLCVLFFVVLTFLQVPVVAKLLV
jgi:hypothetical protein